MNSMIVSVLSCLALTLLPVACGAAATSGESIGYPNKPIRFISGAAGSPPDVAARIVMERVGSSLGQPIVIDNRPGAIGTIALHAVAKASPDGYTFGAFALPHVLAPALLAQLPFDIRRDLAPVAQMTWSSHILVVRIFVTVENGERYGRGRQVETWPDHVRIRRQRDSGAHFRRVPEAACRHRHPPHSIQRRDCWNHSGAG